MITIDKVELKKGLMVWEVGITTHGERIPTLSIFNGGINDVTNKDRCWKSYELCKVECQRLNKKEYEDFINTISKRA